MSLEPRPMVSMRDKVTTHTSSEEVAGRPFFGQQQ